MSETLNSQNRFNNGKHIYSVDMMFAYVDIFKNDLTKGRLVFKNQNDKNIFLEQKSWTDDKKPYGPIDVIKNPKKYKSDWDRIQKADLKFPIFMDKIGVVDGYHRVTKALLEGKNSVSAYVFDDATMKKFIVGSDTKQGWEKSNKMTISQFIELFYKRFC